MTMLRKYFPCEMPHGWPPTANPTRRPKSPLAASPEAPTGLADGAIGCWHTAEVRPPVDMRGAMAPVCVVTAASGDTYRIARVYLDCRDGT